MTAQSEADLINCIVTTGSAGELERAKQYGIMDEHWGVHLATWQSLCKYVLDYGSLPPHALLGETNKDFPVYRMEGDVLFYAEIVHREYVIRATRGVLTEYGTKPLEDDPDAALRIIMERLAAIRPASKRSLIYLDGDAGQRLATTEARYAAVLAGANPFAGIPTGIEPVDLMGEGWLSGTINAIVGNTSTGKSQLALRTMIEAWLGGVKVLLVSPEMPANLLGWRSDNMLAHARGMKDMPTNRQIMHGDMPEARLQVYRELIKDWQAHKDIGVLDTFGREEVVSVGEIRRAAREHGARLVVVDGFRMLTDQRAGRIAVERNHNVIRDLLAMSAADSVATLLVEHTSSDVKKQNELPTIGQIYMGPALNQWSDKMVTVAMTRNSMERIMAMPKNRRGTPFFNRKVISFDVDNGDIGRWIEPETAKRGSDIGRFLPELQGGPLE